MKTLKKILTLTLTLVMITSLVPLAAGASGFNDETLVSYNEQVAVLAGIGVIEGFPDGDLQPGSNVTRAQACAIVARLLLTRTLADSLSNGTTGFKDVAPTHWAAQYIGLCAALNIVVGFNDGSFKPGDSVTGIQFAIMLMRALEIGNPARWKGANWQMHAIIDAAAAGILIDGVDYYRAATREETCAYAFSGLLYSPSGKSVEKQMVIVSYELENENGVIYLKPVYDWRDVEVLSPDSLAAKMYPTLKKDDVGVTDLGRPGMVWNYGDPAKPIYSLMGIPIAVLDGNVTQDALFTITGVGASQPELFTAVVNGKDAQTTATLTSLRGKSASSNSATVYTPAVVNDGVPNGGSDGQGVITEIYKTGTGNTVEDYLIVIIKPGFAQVTRSIHPAAAGIGAHTTYTLPGDVSGDVFTSTGGAALDKNTAVLKGTVSNNDYVLYYKGEEILYIEAPPTMTGKLTSVTSSGIYTVGTNTVTLAAAYATVEFDPLISTRIQTFYVDAFNNILGVKSLAAEGLEIAFVFRLDYHATLEDGRIKYKYFADIVDLTGKVSTVPLAVGKSESDTGTYAWFNYDRDERVGDVYMYDINEDDEYVFSPELEEYHKRSNVTEITRGSADLKVSDGTVKFVNNATIFILINRDDPDRDPTGTVTRFSRNSVPNNCKDLGKEPGQRTVAVSVGTPAGTPTGKPTEANDIANIVYIYDDVYEAVSNPFVFVLGSFTTTATSFDFNVIIEGSPSTISIRRTDAEAYNWLRNKAAGKLFESISVGSDMSLDIDAPKEVTGTTPPERTTPPFYTKAEGSLKNQEGLLVDEGVIYNIDIDSGIPVYKITFNSSNLDTLANAKGESGTAEELDIKLGPNTSAFVVFTTAAKVEVSAIYILVDTKPAR